MADDIKEPDLTQPIKRLNYFTGQFLEKEDFLDEQQYHMAMRRRGNLVLYFGKGVLDEIGFRINDLGTGKIEVTPGVATDSEGREIVLVKEIEIDLRPLNLQPISKYVVTVEYDKQADKEQSTNDNDRSDFTRILEEPEIKVVIRGTQSSEAIVIANLVTKADGTVEKIEYRDRQRAKARFAGDLTIGQGGNGSLSTRHINGKDWRNDDPDDLFLNWGNARDVHIGGQTRSSLFVNGHAELKAPDSEIYSLKLSRTDEAGRQHQWALWHMNQQYRKNALEIWEYKSDSTGKICDGNPADGAMCTPRLVIAEGGYVGIGTTDPKATLDIKGTLKIKGNGGVLNIEGSDHAFIQWYPDGFQAGRKAWIGYGSAHDNGLTIRNDIPDGPVHIYGESLLYLLNKQGVIVGKHWGGNGNLSVEGDVAIGGKHALRGNDAWLRLNQDGAFADGVHTPGLLYPGKLKVGHEGAAFTKVQAGTAEIGPGYPGVSTEPCKRVQVTFPASFTDTPKVIATVRGNGQHKETFAVTTSTIDASGFFVNVRRLDAGPVSWGQNLQVDWFAWTQE